MEARRNRRCAGRETRGKIGRCRMVRTAFIERAPSGYIHSFENLIKMLI